MARRARGPEAGFSLIELMIALVLFSFAIIGVLSIGVTMVSGFREQRLTISTEQSARMSMEFIADAVRGASPAVPAGDIVNINANNCATGAFTFINGSNAPDSLIVVYPSGSVVTSLRTAYTSSTNTAVTVADGSQFSVGDTILITNTVKGHLVKITSVSGNNLGLLAPAAACTATLPSGGYGAGALVIRAERAQFYVTDIDAIPTLMMDPTPDDGVTNGEPLAEGIEDFQVALGIDLNGDGSIAEIGNASSDDEWQGNVTGDPAIAGPIRAVRIWMVARATAEIPNGSFTRPAVGDRAASTALDGYRRRILTSIVEIRNLGGSP